MEHELFAVGIELGIIPQKLSNKIDKQLEELNDFSTRKPGTTSRGFPAPRLDAVVPGLVARNACWKEMQPSMVQHPAIFEAACDSG